MISVAQLSGNDLVLGNRCQMPREVLQEMLKAARAGSEKHLIVFGDQLAPLMGHSLGFMPNVPTAIDTVLRLVPLQSLSSGVKVNVIAMIPDARDQQEHKPDTIRNQFKPELSKVTTARGDSQGRDFSIGATPRPDFYNLVEAPGEILPSVGVSQAAEGTQVIYIRTFSQQPYGDLALLVSPRESQLLRSIPTCLPVELVGYMSDRGHQNSILFVPENLFSEIPTEDLKGKEIVHASEHGLEEMLTAGLKLWIPDAEGYEVYKDSAPKHGLAVYGGGHEQMRSELSQQYGGVYGEYALSELSHFLKDRLLQCVVVVKDGDTAAQLRNGVSGHDGGL